MELLGWLIHALFGEKESAKPAPNSYTSTDGKEKVFDNYEDFEDYEEKEALKKKLLEIGTRKKKAPKYKKEPKDILNDLKSK